MTIDEAIAHEREKAEEMYLQGMLCNANPNDDELYGCIECAKEHEHLAEWLEELKAYREIGTVEECKGCVLRLLECYEKGIDDYMNKLCGHCMQETNECYKLECPFFTDGCDIVNIAEQLKAGGENES